MPKQLGLDNLGVLRTENCTNFSLNDNCPFECKNGYKKEGNIMCKEGVWQITGNACVSFIFCSYNILKSHY